ncbi:hypothetical protein LK540_01710 [Massilia sp. IC2-278]|uniref:hypothetical protein n=1 Tax=Massilia sp. IC2-278 TaxID=2887200 RepID=UPI001E5A5EAF|nr:hypothetical protein [Massilia sp. IC2-278]MCC2959144.1 hypothetical protein [Massilia sp. IC2-278]
MDAASPNLFISFLPMLLLSLLMAVPANMLARQKGRNVVLWTILALIPLVNFACMWYFVGASNLVLENKIDELMLELKRSKQ